MDKVCSACKVSKEESYYHKNSYCKDGLSHVCKECRKVRSSKENLSMDHSLHYAKHSRYYRQKAVLRKGSVKQATPPWLTKEHKKLISDLYLHAEDCFVTSGEQYQVDHIVPLKGKDVCGLHVPWNLQILPSDLNLKKSNRF